MKYCDNCHYPIADDTKFCPNCGAKNELPPQAVVYCPNCGSPITPGSKFCLNCGTAAQDNAQLQAEEYQQQEPAQEVPAPAPKKKGKAGLIIAIVLLVLALAAGACWAFGVFGNEPIFGSDDKASSSGQDKDEEEDQGEDEDKNEDDPSEEDTVAAETEPEESTQPEAQVPAERISVELNLWGAAEEQELLLQMAQEFVDMYADQVDMTIYVSVVSESEAKDLVLRDLQGGPDVFVFCQDQLDDLVRAGALEALPGNLSGDVSTRNDAGSVNTCTYDGSLYAFPMTSDNGYFMYYDKSVFSEEDLTSLESMLDAAAAAGRKVAMDLNNAWYLYSFFAGEDLGLYVTMNADGTSSSNWNSETGLAVCQAIMDLASHPAFLNASDTESYEGLQNGTICAIVNGTWYRNTISEAWGENYGACKLPTYQVNGRAVQMGSFCGNKLVGVNAYSDNTDWAMLLADWITNEQNQMRRFEVRGLGPSNINAAASPAVQSDIALSALLAQSPYATAQDVSGAFWNPISTLGRELAEGGLSRNDLEALLAECVTAMEG